MLLSKLVATTTKETPADVKIISHALMVRAGYIKAVANGIYSLAMPAQIMATKIEAIIRDEMNKIDGQEVKFPVVMPRELWEMSGRYNSIGSEMVRFKDRNDRDMLLGMTHEEAAVHLAKNTIISYNQLPCMIYQLQTKFRDEPRARGGLIRVREFTMKDAYSFHLTQEDLNDYYQKCYDAYDNIFRRIGMKNYIAVKSDTGMMGGSVAHEFMLLTDIGEDTLVICPTCGYKANMEVAETVLPPQPTTLIYREMEEVCTGKAHTIEEVCALLRVAKNNTIKAVVYAVKGDDSIVIAFVRGDMEVNEAKLKKITQKNIVPCENAEAAGLCAGNIGPFGLDATKYIVVYDKCIYGLNNAVCGANKADYHIAGVETARNIKNATYYDISKVPEFGICPICGKPVELKNGIEIGNIFQLGVKYTKSMDMSILNGEGISINPIMGCYGIGVGRAMASLIEESNDEKGIILPMSIAPWQVHLIVMRADDALVMAEANKLYLEMKANKIDVIMDDRNASAGVKFADADLMGMPIRVVISPKTIKANALEVVDRATKATAMVERDSIISYLKDKIKTDLEKLA